MILLSILSGYAIAVIALVRLCMVVGECDREIHVMNPGEKK